jgi:TRAP-type C4-dicarboxylate transport system substrate-binding protein
MAAIAPDGTTWAREIRTFSRDVETEGRGEVRLKWYLGGIAGDELTALERVRHGQLDGLAGASFCDHIAPSFSVIRVPGLFESRDEVVYVLARLKPLIDEEARRGGFANLADSVFGADLIFSRRPIHSMAELAATRWWMWDQSPVWLRMMAALEWQVQPTTVDELTPLYEKGAVDGFMVPPGAALAYQWSTMAVYMTPLETAWLPGCVMISNAAMDPLPVEQQRAIRSAAAKFRVRWNDATEQLDQALVDGLFQKQGLQRIVVTPQLRADFTAAMKLARAKLDERQVPSASLSQVEKLLEEYRASRTQSRPPTPH